MTSDRLLAQQLPNGGFESVVTSGRGRIVDCNGFTAAIVLRTTRSVPQDGAMVTVRRRALSMVLTCASSVVPGAFGFWPDAARPAWASSVPADVDDTSIMATELLRYGWLDSGDAVRCVCDVLLPHRVDEGAAGEMPPWVAAGCFRTWVASTTAGRARIPAVNIVDCCVNANAVALMSLVGAGHLPGYTAAIQTIANAVEWAGRDRRRLSAVTPFYPSVWSLADAVEHAVECGADGLRGALDRLQTLDLGAPERDAGCCSSAYGSVVWRCEAIDTARALARAVGRRSPETSPEAQVARD
jgi:hypothetical protein